MLASCEQLHQTGKRVGILSCMSAFSDDYVPSSLNDNSPTPLTELLDDKCYDLNYAELVSVCESLHVSVSEKEAEAVEAATREQAMSKLWFRFRAGRITASKSKSVCHTNPAQPAISLIRGICNPEGSKFSTKATRWVCEHEEVASDTFKEISKMHVNFKVSECGFFFINPDVPYLGASPDRMVWCDCYGEGCLEIKCPFCKKNDQTLSDTESDYKFCLQKDDDGRLRLTDKHAYYYQVQHQLGVCRRKLCYFVVWTEHDVHIEIITYDSELWEHICEKSLHIFQASIRPELVAKFFTRLPNTTAKPACTVSANSSSLASGDSEPLICYCEQVESGDMVCCDNDSCEIKSLKPTESPNEQANTHGCHPNPLNRQTSQANTHGCHPNPLNRQTSQANTHGCHPNPLNRQTSQANTHGCHPNPLNRQTSQANTHGCHPGLIS